MDPLGLLRFSAGFRNAFPRSTGILSTLKDGLSDRVYEAFRKHGFGADRELIDRLLTPGEGPEVGVGSPAGDAYAEYRRLFDLIVFDPEYLAELEACAGPDAALFADHLKRTILHEILHYLENRSGNWDATRGLPDRGYPFELDAFGGFYTPPLKRFDPTNCGCSDAR